MRQSINVMFFPDKDALIPFQVEDELPPAYYTAIQSWTLCFLTVPGTRLTDPDYGTFFLPLLKAGKIYTKDDVYRFFAEATGRCYAYCIPDSIGDICVTQAYITDLDIVTDSDMKKLILYIAFAFSDGTKTRINLEVN